MHIIISIVISVVLASLGWIFGYIISLKAYLKARKKELITEYLVQAYSDLCGECHREKVSEKIEKALTLIQLFGSEQQIQMAQCAVEELASNSNADVDRLLFDLRNRLRDELRIEKTTIPISFVRIKR